MARVKRGTTTIKRRRSILSKTKGFRGGRKSKERQAREALMHAGAHAFAHRKERKRDFRRLWQIRINAAARLLGLSYSALMGMLKKKDIALDRKTLSHLAKEHPDVFTRVVEEAKS